jgi:hypothetical protein
MPNCGRKLHNKTLCLYYAPLPPFRAGGNSIRLFRTGRKKERYEEHNPSAYVKCLFGMFLAVSDYDRSENP